MDVKEDKAQGGTVSLSFTMSVLGPTKVMFEGTPKFWSNKSVPSAVRDLAAKNQLGYTGHDHIHLWSALAQTRESDCTIILAFAKRIGWQIYNRYGVVMCYDPVKLFNESGHLHPARDGHHGHHRDEPGAPRLPAGGGVRGAEHATSGASSATSPPTTRPRSPPSPVTSGATSSAPTW